MAVNLLHATAGDEQLPPPLLLPMLSIDGSHRGQHVGGVADDCRLQGRQPLQAAHKQSGHAGVGLRSRLWWWWWCTHRAQKEGGGGDWVSAAAPGMLSAAAG